MKKWNEVKCILITLYIYIYTHIKYIYRIKIKLIRKIRTLSNFNIHSMIMLIYFFLNLIMFMINFDYLSSLLIELCIVSFI